MTARAIAIAEKVERFVREVVAPYEHDPRRDHHDCPTSELIDELKTRARDAGVLSPHIVANGAHLSQRETALVLTATGLSPLGPLACNTAAPDEGNMYLLGKIGSEAIKRRFLDPLVSGHARSAFFMTEPAEQGGAGSDPFGPGTINRPWEPLDHRWSQGLHHRRRRRADRHRHGAVR